MARPVLRPNTHTTQRMSTSTEEPLCEGVRARTRLRPHRKIFPTLLSDIEKEMLIHLAESSGTTMCATIRQLIRRECATSGVAR